jgi:rhodanese-related sulfurtransferase
LEKAGFKQVGALLGGMDAWEKAGGEVVRPKPTTKF